jgi:hypothetical protein
MPGFFVGELPPLSVMVGPDPTIHATPAAWILGSGPRMTEDEACFPNPDQGLSS